MAKPGRKGVSRIIHAAGYSYKGLKACYRHEAAFRQELLLCVFLTPLSFVATPYIVESALLISTLIIVLIAELLNSAVEAVVDRIGSEYHDLSGRAKDIGSAAVSLSLLLVTVVWVLVIFKNWF